VLEIARSIKKYFSINQLSKKGGNNRKTKNKRKIKNKRKTRRNIRKTRKY
jgi:hypothetical protein